MFEIFGELLTGFKAPRGLGHVLCLQVLDVNELVFLAKHSMDARETKLSRAAHRNLVKVLNALHLDAQTFQLNQE